MVPVARRLASGFGRRATDRATERATERRAGDSPAAGPSPPKWCHHALVTRSTPRRASSTQMGHAIRPESRAAPSAQARRPPSPGTGRPSATPVTPITPITPVTPASRSGAAVARPAAPVIPAGSAPRTSAPRRTRADPLDGTDRLLIDGSNLLHALRRGAGAAPAATLIGRLRAIIPPTVRIELVFDGPPEFGLRGTRIASGLTVRHSGRYTADSLIDRLVADAIGTGGSPDLAYAAGDAILVVTDDGELSFGIRRRGARTIGAEWLIRRLDRPGHPSPHVGAPRPPRQIGSPLADDDADPPRWNPGRGATRKTGNPKRGRQAGPSHGRPE